MKKIIVIYLILFNYFCAKSYSYDNGMDIYELLGITLNFYSAEALKFTKRYSHTATLLPNDKVLLVGGFNGTNALDTIKLYDSSTGDVSNGPNLGSARYDHTATLLQNGKVLIVGGRNKTDVLNTKELYDPDTNTISTIPNPSDPSINIRTNHTATLLSNGKVFIAGGCESISGNAMNSVEIYDPSSEGVTSINMTQARCSHTATLLTDGKVLVVGGTDESGSNLPSAEVFDPSANSFSYTTLSLNEGRSEHTATLVLSGKVLIFGGLTNKGPVYSGEMYDSTTNDFTYLTNLSSESDTRENRQLHTASLLSNGKVLFTGGNSSSTKSDLYNPSTDELSEITDFSLTVKSHTATILPNGKIMVVGGNKGQNATGDIKFYDPSND